MEPVRRGDGVVVFWPIMDGVFGNEQGSWAGVGMLSAFGGTMPLFGVVSRLETKLEEADYERRLAPVRQSVEACWLMEGKENDYRRDLLRQLYQLLSVASKADVPTFGHEGRRLYPYSTIVNIAPARKTLMSISR